MTAQDILSTVGWEIGQRGDQILFSTQNTLVLQLISLMVRAAGDVANRTEWQALHKSFDTAADVAEVALPADFRELQESGAIYLKQPGGTIDYEPVRVITAPEHWSLIKSRPSSQRFCRLSGGKLQFAPNTGAYGARVPYVSKFWNTNGSEGIGSGADTFNIPERLIAAGTIWRWRRQKGFEFTDLQSEYEADLLEAVAADRGVA